MNIPVLGLVASTGNQLPNFVSGIDHPVDDLIVVFDGCKKVDLPKNPMVGKACVVELPGRIGDPACWNIAIKSRMKSPNWLLSVEGVGLSPGTIRQFAEALERDSHPGIVHASAGDFASGCWDLFLVSEDIVGIMGLFDENLPDWEFAGTDYLMRTAHRPVKKILSLDRPYFHARPSYSQEAAAAQYDYLKSKWGDWTSCNPNLHPFGNPDFAVGYFPSQI